MQAIRVSIEQRIALVLRVKPLSRLPTIRHAVEVAVLLVRVGCGGAIVAGVPRAVAVAAGLAAVPIIALTPLLNNMFNITSRTPRVLVTVIIVFFPMFVNVTRGLVQVQPVQLELMRSIKRALDPTNLMNPGRVVRV